MKDTLGLVITFNPSPQFYSNLIVLLSQLDSLLLIDNGSNPEIRRLLERETAGKKSSLHAIFNDENFGVAAALNQGFRWALAQGYGHVISFDQDSRPAPGMVSELLRAYNSHPDCEKIAIVAPQIQDGITGEKIAYLRTGETFHMERVSCEGDVIDDAVLVITSGSLNNLSAYGQVGAFRDDFFVDYVDTEYCLRAQERGYKIIVACNAILHHRLGNQQTKQVGPLAMRPTFHSPLRWYYINRNRIAMYRLYALRFPQWVLHDVSTACYTLLKMLLFEDQKLRKILALGLGVFDGILRRMGPASVKRKASITTGE